jgi:predicted nucleic acid-binding protein
LLPEYALEEVRRHRQKIARYARLTPREVDLLLNLLVESVTVVPRERILPSFQEAEAMMGSVDPDDVPFVALALAVENNGIWSNDRAFERLPGIKVWKTSEIRKYLRQR